MPGCGPAAHERFFRQHLETNCVIDRSIGSNRSLIDRSIVSNRRSIDRFDRSLRIDRWIDINRSIERFQPSIDRSIDSIDRSIHRSLRSSDRSINRFDRSIRVKDGRTDGRQEVEVLMALVVMEAEVPGAGGRPQALFTQV